MSETLLLTVDVSNPQGAGARDGAGVSVHDTSTPLLYADDLAALRGDGIFETLLVAGGTARNVERHLDRFERSAKALDLPIPDRATWESAIEQAQTLWAAEHDVDADAVMRLVYSRGRERDLEHSGEGESCVPTAYLTVAPAGERGPRLREQGVSVITVDRGYSIDLAAKAPWQLLGAKTLSYATNMAALRHAAERGVDDVLYTSSEGVVLEAPRASVVAVYDKTLVTTPPDYGVLAGTTVAATFALAQEEGWRTETRAMRTPDLIKADSVWLMSSLTLAARVTSLNGYDYENPLRPREIPDLVRRAVLGE
ncbi:aminodeoxychorismate lyase [Gordonia jinhuaensis]|uniref:Aminotransferase, class IV n=1 Tax=Gordonia jinhuaensis TaxID=1517702 RepID=A0A916T6K9_9ACTN|nr:aminodeoxychorismate lyase [Gordonia jinhuaensis]GGB32434.1 putative aminotransferase, class IV [Gordonia jinhuaensis]